MYLKLRTLLLPFFVMVFSVCTIAVQAQTYTEPNLPTVTSDKLDYAPGEVAHITGTGWTLDDSVHVEFKETPDYPDYHIYDLKVNSDGTWQIDYAIELRHLGVTFTVVATGKQSGYTATTVFTDAASYSAALSSPASPICQGSNQSYKIRLTSSSGTIMSATLAIPSGVTDIAGLSCNAFKSNGTSIGSWTNQSTSTLIKFFSPASSTNIGNNEYIEISFTATAGTSGSNTWTTSAFLANNYTSADPFSGSQPVITVTGTPVLSITQPSAVCSPGTIDLTATAVTNGSTLPNGTILTYWTNAAATTSLSNPNAVDANGTYYIKAANGTCSDIKPVTVTINTTSAPTGTASQTFCNSATVADLAATGTGIKWYTAATGGSLLASTAALVNSNHYYASQTLNGCESSSRLDVTVTINTPSAPTVAAQSFLTTDNATVASLPDGGGSYKWYSASTGGTALTSTTTLTSTTYYVSTTSGTCESARTAVTVSINKAQPTITWAAAGTVTYGSTLNGKLNAVAKFNGSAVAGTYVYKQGLTTIDNTTVLNASTTAYSLSVSFTPDDVTTYEATTGTNSITVNKATSVTTITVTGGPFTYTGDPITPATVSVTGAGGLSLTPAATYSNNTNAGTATANYSFAGDDNHEPSNDSKTFSIRKADAMFADVDGYTGTYDGNAHGATGTAKGVKGETLEGLDLGDKFTNVPGGTATWTFTDVTGNYNNATGTAPIVLSKANATFTIVGYTGTYDGNAHAASGTASGVKSEDLSGLLSFGTGITDVPGGSATWSFAGNGNYNSASGSKAIVLSKASSATVVTITGGPFTYTGAAQTPATVSVIGAGGLSLTPAATYSNNTNAGTATASYSFAGDGNHESSSDSRDFTIGKANATINVNGYTGTYDGDAHGATGTAKGVKGESLTGLDLGDTFTDVPGGTATWNFTDATGNYKDATGTAAIAISRAASTTVVTINGGPFTYTGSAIKPATVSVTGVGGLSLTPTPTYSNNTNAGTATASYTFDGDNNHEGSNDSKDFTIGKANAVITVTPYSVTYNGNAHTSEFTAVGVEATPVDLSALMTVSGTTHTNAGDYKNDAWSFAGNNNYKATSGTVDNAISKAPSVTEVTITGAPFTYTGNPITPATVSVTGAGSLSLTPTATYSNNTNAGTATASYSFAGDDNHLASQDSKTFTIGKANATINVNGYTGTYDGNAHGATGTAKGVKDETLTGLDLGDTFTDVPGGTANWTFTDATGNYKDATGTAAIAISRAASTTVVTIASGPFTYTGDPITPATVKVTGAGGLSMTPAADYANNTNAGTATASYTYAGDANHTGSNDSKDFTIGKANATISVNGYTGVYDGNAHGASGSATGVKNEDLGSLLHLGSSFTNVPGGTANWSFDGNSNYNGNSGTAAIAISKAPSTTVVTITGGPFTYTGAAQTPATVKVTGAGGLSMTPAADYANNTNAGTATASYAYAGDANHVGSNDSKDFTIARKAASVTPALASKYCGQSDPTLTGSLSGFVSTDNVTAVYSRTPGETAGTIYTISATLSPAGVLGNYNITYNTANFTISGVSIDASASGTPVAINATATLSAKISPAVGGVAVTFTLDNGVVKNASTGSDGIATATVSGLAVGVYQVTAVAGAGCGTPSIAYLPIYDPNSGFVTGGGWSNSPAGALKSDPNATGKATFGFVAKYKKGSTTLLEGETEFQFQAGNLKFNSSTYDAATLVISGYKATYRGTGTINGTGSYKFMLAAVDGDITGGGGTDKIRMKITDLSGNVVYDNQMGSADNADASTVLGGGSIVIHSDAKKTNTQQAVTMNNVVPEVTGGTFGLTAFPNPAQDQFKLHLESSNTTGQITLRVYDAYGRTVRLIRELTAGQTVTLGSEYRPGIYYVEMLQGKNRTQVKLLKVVY